MSVLRRSILLALLGEILTSPPGHSHTLHVALDGSQQYAVIQLALNASLEGDTVLVEPGTYHENLNFGFSHNLVLMSRLGRDVTTLDGSGANEAAIRMRNGQTRATVVQGFTITGGTGSPTGPGGILRYGGGVFVQNSEPTIRGNTIWRNGGMKTRWGGGIYCETFGSRLVSRIPLITGNEITENAADNGGGVGCLDLIAAEILGNRIELNQATSGDGGGIWIITAQGGTVIEDNVIRGNTAQDHGGGIACASSLVPPPDILIAGNEVSGNTAYFESHFGGSGSGVYLTSLDATMSHNTICANSGPGGGITIDYHPGAYHLVDNIIALTAEGGGLSCVSDVPIVIEHNLAWANAGGDGMDLCPDWVEEGGNIEQDPYFCDAPNGNFTVAENSPALLSGSPIGAYDAPGCPPVAIALRTTWGSIKARYAGGRY